MAYMRRKRYEARLVAVEVGQLFAGSQSGRAQRDDPATVLGMIGVDW